MRILNRKLLGLKLPEIIFLFAIFSVILSFLLFYLIDLNNIFGLRDILISADQRYFFFWYQPFFFHHWGRNSGFAEIIQFTFLGLGVMVSAYSSGVLFYKEKRLSKFWIIMSIALLFMLLQDAGDMRHLPMSYVQWMSGEIDQGIMGTSVELLYFAILGGIPLYALVRYWRDIKVYIRSKYYLLIGFFFYALAGGLSFIGTAFEGLMDSNIYNVFGEYFYNFALRLGDGNLVSIWEETSFNVKFFLMDSLLEENLEIIASGSLLASIFAFLITYTRGEKTIRK
jgi:hypothetical protein